MELMLLLQNLTTQKSLWANLVCVFSATRVWGSYAKKMSKLPSGTVFRASKFRMCALFYISLLWTTFSDDFAVSTRETSISSLGKVIPCISHEIKPFAPWYLTHLFLHLDVPSLENANLTWGMSWEHQSLHTPPVMPVPEAPLSVTHCQFFQNSSL